MIILDGFKKLYRTDCPIYRNICIYVHKITLIGDEHSIISIMGICIEQPVQNEMTQEI